MPEIKSNNPLHGITLQKMLTDLETWYGWPGLGQRIRVKCFTENPSISSSLKFLRKTAWARTKVESLYLMALSHKLRKAQSEPEVPDELHV